MFLKILIFGIIFTTLCQVSIPALAHVSSVDNGIEVMMHIDPGDAPATGQSTFFNIYYQDANSKFRIQNCDCIYTIEPNFKAGFDTQKISNLKQTSENFASFETNFTNAGSYKITIAGEPKAGTTASDTFSSFQISFDFYVDSPASDNTHKSILVDYGTTLFVLLIILYLGWIAFDVFKNRHL